MSGLDVSVAQGRLSIFLKRPIKIDGIFGEETVTATKEAQRKFGITVDGAIGPVTWEKLRANSNVPSAQDNAPPNWPVVKPTPAFQIIEQGETKINQTTLIIAGVGILGLLYFLNRKKRK